MPKLIHCADIHLDTPFHAGSAEQSAMARRELRRVFSSVIQYIKNEGIDVALFAGDIFDSTSVTADTVSFFKGAMASCPDCAFVIAPGNHDPYTAKSVYERGGFSENVFIFDSNELSYFDFPKINLRVYGYAFTSSSLDVCPFAGKTVDKDGKINILCAHGDVGNPLSPYCPISEKDIEGSGFDYCAFGHIHLSDDVKCAGNVPYAYSGCLSGRDFGETGKKGAIVIDINDGKLSFERKYFSKYDYECATCDLSSITDIADIREKVGKTISDYNENTLLRVELIGYLSVDTIIDVAALTDDFKGGVYYLEIIDSTLPMLNTESLEKDVTIVGAFFRELKPILENGTPDERRTAAKALRVGLSALRGDDLPL